MDNTIVFFIVLCVPLAVLIFVTFIAAKGALIFIEEVIFNITKKPCFVYTFDIGKGLNPIEEDILYKYFKYYRLLPENKKRIFSHRVRKFMNCKTFEGRKNLEVTDEMRILISATAVKINFGFRNYKLPHFHTIIIYPDEYFSSVTNTTNKGETNTQGVIVFSWKDFLKGFEIEDDSLNLGYHEFAHALFVDEKSHTTNPCFTYYYEKWYEILRDGHTVKKIRDNNLFRDYGTVNENEFFAVALEIFLETPEKLKNELPELFDLMCLMLNQYPLNKEEESF